MDSGALLDILGNHNRRRILRLLAQKPCYVTEISDYLDVSPKAVIDHLRKLEEAGLVTSRTDENRRKYFYIANNVRLEVNVSRYGYGAKSAYPARSSLDIGACEHLTVNLDHQSGSLETDNIVGLSNELKHLEELENELSMAQRYVQGCLLDVIDRIAAALETDAQDVINGRMFFEILVAIAEDHKTMDELRREVEVPKPILENALHRLQAHDVLGYQDGEWQILGKTSRS